MQEYHSKAKRGIKLLLGRQVVVQAITFIAGVIIARTMRPDEVGLYLVCLLMLNLLSLISDFGLAPSLIQRKGELTDEDLQVGFTLQQIVTSILIVLLLTAAPVIVRNVFPNMPQVIWLVRALSFNLYLTSWRAMSALQMERHLKYGSLAKIEIAETMTYQTLAVTLALAGFGVWSFIVAALAQGILGAVLTYLASPWKVRLRFDWKVAKSLIRFGVPFQFQAIMNSTGAWVTTFIIGRQVGPAAIGYLNWASSNGRKPLMVTDSVMRVAFPHFSRIQDNVQEVERIITRYLSGMFMLAALWLTGIVATCPGIVTLIYTEKWLPAVPALIMYAIALWFDMMGMIVGVSLNGLGRMRFVTQLVICRMVINVGLTVAFVYLMRHGNAYNGVPLAYLVASVLVVPLMLIGLGKGAVGRISAKLTWVLLPTALGVGTGLGVTAISRSLPLPVHVGVSGLAALVAFMAGTWWAAPDWLHDLAMSKLGIRGRALVVPSEPGTP